MGQQRWRTAIAVLGIALIAGGPALAAPAATAGPATSVVRALSGSAILPSGKSAINPFTLAGGFTVYSHGDAVLGNSEFEGSLAVGGELRLTQGANYQFAHKIAGTGSYVLPTIDGDPTRLLIGSYGSDPATNIGRVQITSTGATQPSQIGDLKIVDRTGPFISFTRASWLRYGLAQGTDSPPLIDAENQVYPDDSVPPTTSAGGGSIYTYDTGADTRTTVADYVEANAQANEGEIDQCLVEIADPDGGLGHPVEVLERAGDRIVLGTLSTDQPNVLEYADIEGAHLLQFSDGTPGPLHPLIIHVEPGTTSIVPPAIDPEGTYSPYVMWDLSEVTGPIDISTDGRGDGSIYAPNADLTIRAQPWDGQVIANSVVILGGEVHSFLFNGALPCDAPVGVGTFSVSKSVDGVAAADLAPGTTFSVRYVALAPDGTSSTDVLELTPDNTVVTPGVDFPFGTRVTLFEIAPGDDVLPPDMAWGDVTWSGDTTFTIDATNPSPSLVVTDTAAPIPAGFSVTKAITGSGATVIPSGAQFTLEYEVDGSPSTELVVTPGTPAVVDDLVAGDVVTISEIALPDVDGVTWGTPTWTVGGVPVEPDENGEIVFTLVGEETIAVELTNTADAVGWFSGSKTVIGDGRDAIPDGTEFPLVYSLDGGPESTVSVPADEVVTSDALPAGTVVTIREGELPEVPGVAWGTPGWTIDGVPQVPDVDGNVTFVVQPGTTVSLALTNTANGVGSVAFTKSVTGPASDLVPAGTTYPIEYRVSNGPTSVAEVTAGEPLEISDLPTGVTVHLREGTLPEIAGVAWGSPVWTVDGQSAVPDADGWVSVESSRGATVTFALANDAEFAPGGFALTKRVTGDGASSVPADTTFRVTYRVDGGAAQELLVQPGETVTVTDLPPGSTVTFAEAALPTVAGVTWGAPVWAVDGATTAQPSITIAAGQVIELELRNAADAPDVLPASGFDLLSPLGLAAVVLLSGCVLLASRRIRAASPSVRRINGR